MWGKAWFRLEKIRFFLFFLFVLSISFSPAINNITFALLLAISGYYWFFKNENKRIKIRVLGIISLLILTYLLLDVTLLGKFSDDARLLGNYFILFLSPFLFWGNKKNIVRFKKGFLLAYSFFFLFTLYGVTRNFIEFGEFNFYKFGGGIKDFLLFERLYIGFSSIIAGILVVDIFDAKKSKKYIFLFAILLINFLIASRLAFITLVFIFVTQLVFDFRKKITLKQFSFITIAVIGVFFIGLKNEGFQKRLYLNSDSLEDFVLQIKIKEPRYAIWRCVLRMDDPKLGFNKWTGYSSQEKINKNLVDCYASSIYIDDKREWFVKSAYNTHNQFLFTYLYHGIIGVSLLIVFFFVLLYARPTIISWYFILAIILFFSIENALYRQIGTYLIGICIGFIVMQDRTKRGIT